MRWQSGRWFPRALLPLQQFLRAVACFDVILATWLLVDAVQPCMPVVTLWDLYSELTQAGPAPAPAWFRALPRLLRLTCSLMLLRAAQSGCVRVLYGCAAWWGGACAVHVHVCYTLLGYHFDAKHFFFAAHFSSIFYSAIAFAYQTSMVVLIRRLIIQVAVRSPHPGMVLITAGGSDPRLRWTRDHSDAV